VHIGKLRSAQNVEKVIKVGRSERSKRKENDFIKKVSYALSKYSHLKLTHPSIEKKRSIQIKTVFKLNPIFWKIKTLQYST